MSKARAATQQAPVQAPVKAKSIWAVTQEAIASIGTMITHGTSMFNLAFMTGEKLCHSGYVMADSNDRIQQFKAHVHEAEYKTQAQINYPDLDWEEITNKEVT